MKPFYDKDGITLYHADNRAATDTYIGKFDLMLTDPPYGLGWSGELHSAQRLTMVKKKWDDKRADIRDVNKLRRRCKYQVIWGGNLYRLPLSRCWLSWYKPDAVQTMGNVEHAWTNLDQTSRVFPHSIAATNAERVGHPTQKPLRVAAWCIGEVERGLAKGEKITTLFDPWVGSGTMLLAAKLRGIRAVGFERDLEYCEMTVRRLAQGVLSL